MASYAHSRHKKKEAIQYRMTSQGKASLPSVTDLGTRAVVKAVPPNALRPIISTFSGSDTSTRLPQ
jgi:hypothetical protein